MTQLPNNSAVRNGHFSIPADTDTITTTLAPDYNSEYTGCDTIAPYNLPLRLDFKCYLPPFLARLKHSNMLFIEIHVPKGCVQTYASHPHWGKCGIITDDAGEMIDNFSDQYLVECNGREQDLKTEKLDEMALNTHASLAKTILAPWNAKVTYSYCVEAKIPLGAICIKLSANSKTPFTFWQQATKVLPKPDACH